MSTPSGLGTDGEVRRVGMGPDQLAVGGQVLPASPVTRACLLPFTSESVSPEGSPPQRKKGPES